MVMRRGGSSVLVRAAGLARAGTTRGGQKRDEFLSDLIHILGDARFIWLPKSSETTTSTDESRHGVTVTYDATIAARISRQGSGVYVDFDGDDDEADTPDVANHSFGDSLVDQPFSLVWLGKPDTDTSVQTLISKQNSGSVDEWELGIEATTGYPQFFLVDASSSNSLGREDQTAIGTSDTLLVATYDGGGDEGGMRIYKDGTRVDDVTAGATPLSYVAMEDTASLVQLGARYSTPAQFYNGKMGLACITGKELNVDEVSVLKKLVNAFFDISL
jgi:hypothetical protein